MVNAWMQTVQKVKNSMPKGTALKDILIAAKKVYKKPQALAVGAVSTVKKAARKVKKTLKRKRRRKSKGNKKRRTAKKSRRRRRRK